MTWLGDKVQRTEPEKAKLLTRREVLVEKLKEMRKVSTFRSVAAANFHMEDMLKLAKEINSIDRKLGRV